MRSPVIAFFLPAKTQKSCNDPCLKQHRGTAIMHTKAERERFLPLPF